MMFYKQQSLLVVLRHVYSQRAFRWESASLVFATEFAFYIQDWATNLMFVPTISPNFAVWCAAKPTVYNSSIHNGRNRMDACCLHAHIDLKKKLNKKRSK
jgi:hypothetical protein